MNVTTVAKPAQVDREREKYFAQIEADNRHFMKAHQLLNCNDLNVNISRLSCWNGDQRVYFIHSMNVYAPFYTEHTFDFIKTVLAGMGFRVSLYNDSIYIKL